MFSAIWYKIIIVLIHFKDLDLPRQFIKMNWAETALETALGGVTMGVLLGYSFGGMLYQFAAKTIPFHIVGCGLILLGSIQLVFTNNLSISTPETPRRLTPTPALRSTQLRRRRRCQHRTQRTRKPPEPNDNTGITISTKTPDAVGDGNMRRGQQR